MENNGYDIPYSAEQVEVAGVHVEEITQTLNRVFLGSLDEYSPRYEERLDLPLYGHQRALVAAMLAREHGLRNGMPTSAGPDTQLFGRYAILGDGPSTGKSWTALSYIQAAASRPTLNKAAYLHQLSDTNFFSIRTLAAAPTRHQTNLIVVPTGLLNEWIELLGQVDLRHLIVRRKKLIDADDFIEKCSAVDVVVVPHTIYAHFYGRVKAAAFRFTRAFVDDWANIPLNGAMSIDAEFTWLLTPAWYHLLFEHTYSHTSRSAIFAAATPNIKEFLRRVFNEDEGIEYSAQPSSRSIFNTFLSRHPDRHHLIVRCSEHFIKESIGLIQPREVKCTYTGDNIMNIIVSMSSRAVQEPLAEGRFGRVLEMIGATTLTTAQWEERRATVLRRNVSMDQCPICFDSLSLPTLTNCCQNFFCAECLFKSCQSRGTQTCPMCRGLLQGLRLTVIDDSPKEESRHPKKVDVLITQLRERAGKSNLIYFPAEPMYGLLRAALRNADVEFDVLMGNHIVQKRKLEQFRNGGINNLIVFDRRPLLHKDMSHVSTVFIYPDVVSRTDKDRLIYLTQRIGRTAPLEVVEFISEN